MSYLLGLFRTLVNQQNLEYEQSDSTAVLHILLSSPPEGRNDKRSRQVNKCSTSADHNHSEAHSNDAIMWRQEQTEIWIGAKPEMDSGCSCASTMQSASYGALV